MFLIMRRSGLCEREEVDGIRTREISTFHIHMRSKNDQ